MKAANASAYSGRRNDSGGSADDPRPGASQATTVKSLDNASVVGIDFSAPLCEVPGAVLRDPSQKPRSS
jgi:hypothetical protein